MVTGQLKGSHPRRPLLDVAEVAAYLRDSPRHIRRLVAERRIPCVKVGRYVRFDPDEIDAWLRVNRRDVILR
jgi:excisionase family DNA binding protein